MTVGRFISRSFSIITLIVGFAISVAVCLCIVYQVAKVETIIAWLLIIALFVFLVCFYLCAVVARWLWRTAGRRFALIAAAIGTVLFAVILGVGVLRPMHYPHLQAIARSNTQYWDLPSGSHIAYSVYEPPAGTPVQPDPIVYIHGGPGFRSADFDLAFYKQFANDGFRVFLFDQAGSGLSARLPHAADYTVERYVSDIEQIRQKIGAQRLILIGHSWGATLAAHYAAAFPDHVSKMVLQSPGPLWFPTVLPVENQRTALGDSEPLPPLRVIAAFELAFANPNTAENFASQTELSDWERTSASYLQVTCRGEPPGGAQKFGGSELAGVNMYPALVAMHELRQPKMDVTGQLKHVQAPTILLQAECDYVPWAEHLQFLQSIPNITMYYFPHAGHFIILSQPDLAAAVIRSFLLGTPAPFPATPITHDPRPPLPTTHKT